MVQAWDYLLKGGPVMWPLFVCAIAAIVVMVERFVFLIKTPALEDDLMRDLRGAAEAGNWQEATRLTEGRHGPIAEILAYGVSHRYLGRNEVERLVEARALDAAPRLSLRLGVLDTVITVAPLLGLLGTVTGMIRSFHVVASASGLSTPTGITSGVAEALIATATGLSIAIVTLVGYNYLTERVKEITSEIEATSAELLTLIPAEPTGKPDNLTRSTAAV